MSGAHLTQIATGAGLRMPAALTVAVTGACNLRCWHCFVEAGLPGAVSGDLTEVEDRCALRQAAVAWQEDDAPAPRARATRP